MTKIYKIAKPLPSMVDHIDSINMPLSDRAAAKARMRDAEMIADLMVGMEAGILAAAALIKAGCATLAQRTVSALKKPVHD